MPGLFELSEQNEIQKTEERNRRMEEDARRGSAASTGPSASPGVYHGNAAASSELGAASGTPDSGKKEEEEKQATEIWTGDSFKFLGLEISPNVKVEKDGALLVAAEAKDHTFLEVNPADYKLDLPIGKVGAKFGVRVKGSASITGKFDAVKSSAELKVVGTFTPEIHASASAELAGVGSLALEATLGNELNFEGVVSCSKEKGLEGNFKLAPLDVVAAAKLTGKLGSDGEDNKLWEGSFTVYRLTLQGNSREGLTATPKTDLKL